MTRRVSLERQGSVALVVMESPETANAVDLELGESLAVALGEVAGDMDLRAMVLTGRGKAFSAGANMRALGEEMERPGQDASEALNRFVRAFSWAAMAIVSLRIPVIAAVNGAASGGGLTLAMACDVVYGAENARFDPAYLRLGLVPTGGMTWLMPHLLGTKKAAEFLLRAKPVDAVEADRIGLINRVIPTERLLDESLALARELAALPPTAISSTKRLLADQTLAAITQQMERENEFMAACSQTPEHRALLDELIQKLRR